MSFRIPYNGAGIAFIKQNNKDNLEDFSIFMGKRSMPPFYGTFSIPGGSVEKRLYENSSQGAIREFREETSIDPLPYLTCYLGNWIKRFPLFKWVTFFYLTNESFEKAIPNEFSELKWIPYNSLRNLKTRPFTNAEMQKGLYLLKNYLK